MSKVVQTLISKVDAQKKRNVKMEEISQVINTIMATINYFNSLDEHDSVVWGHHSFDEIDVPEEFAQFVRPASVRYEALNFSCQNLVDQTSCDKITDYSDYLDAIAKLRGFFKLSSNDGMVRLSSCRTWVALNDVLPYASIGGNVRAGDKPHLPLPIKGCENLFKSHYYNVSEEDMLKLFLSEFKFKA